VGVWVSLVCMRFLILTFFPLNIMIRSSPAFSKKKLHLQTSSPFILQYSLVGFG
jgi:hypothetical protein